MNYRQASDKLVEAHSVIINIQNIKKEIINQLPTGVNIREVLVQLDNEMIKGVIEGYSDERTEELKRRKLMLKEFEKEHKKSMGQTNGSSGNYATTSDSEKINPLLRDVNRLLLEEITSKKT